MKRDIGFLALLTTGFLYGSFGIFVRVLGTEFSTFQQIFLRNFVGLIPIAAILYFKKIHFDLAGVAPKYLALYTLTFPLSIIFFTLSILHTKIPVTIFSLYAGSVLTTMIFGVLLFHEKITTQKFFAMILILVGLALFTLPFSWKSLNVGVLFGVLAGFGDGVTYTFKKYLGGKMQLLTLVGLELTSGALISFLVILLVGVPFAATQFTVQMIVVCLVFGSIAALLSYVSLVGFKNFDLNLGTMVTSSEIIFAIFLAALFFHEFPTVLEFWGGISVGFAIIIAQSNTGVLHVAKKLFGKNQLAEDIVQE